MYSGSFGGPCGFGEKSCGVCANAGGCLAAMYEDLYSPASKEQILDRMRNGRYICDREIMEKRLKVLEAMKK